MLRMDFASEAQERTAPDSPGSGFTVTELLITVACLLVLGAFLFPAISRSKARPSRLGCSNNMMQVAMGFLSWSTDNQGRFPMQVPIAEGGSKELVGNGKVFQHFQVLSNELSTPKILVCPNDRKRSPATNFAIGFTDANLSYFLGLDAARESGSSLLSGDRNLTNRPETGTVIVNVRPNMKLGWGKDLHSGKANVCFGDGSARQVQNGFMTTGTIRLALP
jgi:prepilin-type processing-associated H-X9-DG protein